MQKIELVIKTVPASSLESLEARKHYEKLNYLKLPDRLNGDELRLKQILINLVKNALKFTTAGHVRILAGYDSKKGSLVVHVADSGRGVTREELP